MSQRAASSCCSTRRRYTLRVLLDSAESAVPAVPSCLPLASRPAHRDPTQTVREVSSSPRNSTKKRPASREYLQRRATHSPPQHPRRDLKGALLKAHTTLSHSSCLGLSHPRLLYKSTRPRAPTSNVLPFLVSHSSSSAQDASLLIPGRFRPPKSATTGWAGVTNLERAWQGTSPRASRFP